MRYATILVSLYKAAKFLHAKLESLRQLVNFGDCHIVLLNCQNLENEQGIYSSFLDFKNVSEMVFEQHLNVYKAWTQGIIASEGNGSQYLMNSNADDILHPEYVVKCGSFLDNNEDFAIVSSQVLMTDTPNQLWPDWKFDDRMPIETYPVTSAGPCPLWRRSLHQKYGYFEDYRVIGDALFWEKLFAGGEKFGLIKEDLVLYYRSALSLERRHSPDGMLLRDLDMRELHAASDHPGGQ